MNGLKAENTHNHFYVSRIWDGDRSLADIDERGEIVASWTYDAWNNALTEEVSVLAPAAVRYRFQGR